MYNGRDSQHSSRISWIYAWHDISKDTTTRIRLIQIDDCENVPSAFDPIAKTMSLIITEDKKWHLYVLGCEVTSMNCPALQSIPAELDHNSAKEFLARIEHLRICPGNLKKEHIEVVRGKREKVVHIDLTGHTKTVRHQDCYRLILPSETCCPKCHFSQAMLRMRLARANFKGTTQASGKRTNWRYMNTPQKRQQHIYEDSSFSLHCMLERTIA